MKFDEWWETYRLENAAAAANYRQQTEGEEYPLLNSSSQIAAENAWTARDVMEGISRVGDMHATLALCLKQQRDGDIVVTIEKDGFAIGYQGRESFEEPFARVEFCVSGGRSRKTHQALIALMQAMKEDNETVPISI